MPLTTHPNLIVGMERMEDAGVSENIIEASWQALVDSIQYKLSKDNVNKNERE